MQSNTALIPTTAQQSGSASASEESPLARSRPKLSELGAIAAGGLAFAYPVYLGMMFHSHTWILAANGRPAVTDFLVFWLAGYAGLHGAAGSAYVPAIHHAAEVAAAGHNFTGELPWRYSPLFFFVAAPLAALPYLAAFLVWVVGTLSLYAFVAARIAAKNLALLVSCAAPAVFINAICGQNGPLTAVLIGGALYFLEEQPMLAGLCIGLLSYKPQFGILFPLILVAGRHWRALLAAAVATVGTTLFSSAVFGFASLRAFLHYLPITSNSLLVHGANGFAKLQTVYGLMRWLGYGNTMGWVAQALTVMVVVIALVWLWRRDVSFALKAAALATATLIATPHLYAYDFAVLTVAFAFLYRERAFDAFELAGVAAANLLVGAFLFFPSPIGLLALLIAVALIARRVIQSDRKTASLLAAQLSLA